MASRRKLAGAAAIAALLPVATVHAQTVVSNVWPVGSILAAMGTAETYPSTCSVSGGPASLTTGTDSFISLSVVYTPPYVKYSYPTFFFGSAAHLVFNTARSGVVEFDNYYVGLVIPPPPTPKAPVVRFSKYTSVVTANPPTLKVSFDLTVGDCAVSVTGIFHQP
jgi:hypothetical protein